MKLSARTQRLLSSCWTHFATGAVALAFNLWAYWVGNMPSLSLVMIGVSIMLVVNTAIFFEKNLIIERQMEIIEGIMETKGEEIARELAARMKEDHPGAEVRILGPAPVTRH